MDLPELIRPSVIARALGVTPQRVYQMIETGALPAVRGVNGIRIPRLAWEKWLADQNELARLQQQERKRHHEHRHKP